jgi:hypothetical protein
VDDRATDVHQTLAYSRQKLNRKWLAIGLVSLAAGVVIAYLGLDTLYDWLMSGLGIVLGAFMTLYALFRMLVPGKPMLVLSPEGLRLHIEWVKDIVIPWQEVRGVETVDIHGTFRGTPVEFLGVTAVVVSRGFYDHHIHIRSWFLRGPGWDTNFIPQGSTVQVALHHEALPVEAQELYTAVEARWLAFRSVKPAASSVPRVRPGGR